MDEETRELFRDVVAAFQAQQALNATQRRLDEMTDERIDGLAARIDALQAAVRALAADPGEVADAILKVVRDDAS